MKKTLLAVAIAMATTLGSLAQTIEIPKNILSVRGGLTVSSIFYDNPLYTTAAQSKAGFQIEVVDQIRLCKTIPLYLETGLFAAEKGSATKGLDRAFSSYYYVGVPVTINYRWTFAPKFTLDPQLGIYYAYMAGASSNGGEPTTNFSGINRSDFGLRVAVGATYNNRWSLRVGYDLGFLPLIQPDFVDLFRLPKMTNGSFFITLGINFSMIGSKW